MSICTPTAVQKFLDVHETEDKLFASPAAEFGLAIFVQRLPFHRSTNVWDSEPCCAPTAVHNFGDWQETPVSSLEALLVGILTIDHWIPSHMSTSE
jgi:hypothetical protein